MFISFRVKFDKGFWYEMDIKICVSFAVKYMYKSLTKTKKYSELEAYETLKRVASANAIMKHYKSSSLITVKRHAMVLSFFES